ncbi:MAG: hypothetical protein LBP63_00995 [Prevotellaceae bacterium]|jgi:hypothetical protein|nr:hypothetical protein [Prevotellaceae bacterium]
MKKILLILAAFTGLMVMSGCSKDDPAPVPTLSVSPENIQATATAGSYTINVTSNASWTATCAETWCTLTGASAIGNGAITVNVAENTTFDNPRTATVTITAGELTETVSVEQEALVPDVEFTFTSAVIFFNATAQKLTIDWGDGTTDDYVNIVQANIVHGYQENASHTVRIIEEQLTKLDVTSKNITSLDVSGCAALTSLSCSSNQLSSLDLSKNTSLETLYCASNQLVNLNLSNHTALTELGCQSNQLASLDVSGCTALTYLICSNNQLASLDISGCVALGTSTMYSTPVNLATNQLSADALNNIFTALPTVTTSPDISIAGNPGTATCNTSIATDKGWEVY